MGTKNVRSRQVADGEFVPGREYVRVAGDERRSAASDHGCPIKMRLHHGGDTVLTRPAERDSKSSKLLNSSQPNPHFLTSTLAQEKNSKKALALPSPLALAEPAPAVPAKVNDLDS